MSRAFLSAGSRMSGGSYNLIMDCEGLAPYHFGHSARRQQRRERDACETRRPVSTAGARGRSAVSHCSRHSPAGPHVLASSHRCATELAVVMADHYPNLISATLVVNTPPWFHCCWSVVRPFLPADFVEGVRLSRHGYTGARHTLPRTS